MPSGLAPPFFAVQQIATAILFPFNTSVSRVLQATRSLHLSVCHVYARLPKNNFLPVCHYALAFSVNDQNSSSKVIAHRWGKNSIEILIDPGRDPVRSGSRSSPTCTRVPFSRRYGCLRTFLLVISISYAYLCTLFATLIHQSILNA